MSVESRTTLGKRLWSSRNPSCCLAEKKSPLRRGILSRSRLKQRSFSAPMDSLVTLESSIRSVQPALIQDLTSFTWSSWTLSANLPDVSKITSSGLLLEHVPPALPCSAYKRAPYLRSVSEPGTSITTEPQNLQQKQSNLPFPGILLSMSRRISKILISREEPESVDMAEAGRFLLLCYCYNSVERHAKFNGTWRFMKKFYSILFGWIGNVNAMWHFSEVSHGHL